MAQAQAIYVGLAGYVLARRLAEVRSKYRGKAKVRTALGKNAADTRLLIAATYLLVSTLMLVLVAKSGSNINYFLEWFVALGLFAAMPPNDARASRVEKSELWRVLAIGIPASLALAAAFAPLPRSNFGVHSPRARELAQLSAEIASADRPVISDEMVLLIRSGRDVMWEPAIFAELASTGDWDERPFVELIRSREFAFFITQGQRGHYPFDERYNPAVADAIDSAYPVKEVTAGLIIHRRRAQSAVEKAREHVDPAPALRVEPTRR